MKIKVLSKPMFNETMRSNGITNENVEDYKNVIFISINSEYTEKSEATMSYFDGNKSNVLILHFDDVEKDIYEVDLINGQLIDTKRLRAKAMTEEQALEIINFLDNNKKATSCFVHCTAGVSRSGAVGAFVADYFGVKYNDFRKENPRIHENRHVSRLLNNAYRGDIDLIVRCGNCGKKMTLVRPGKYQCDNKKCKRNDIKF